jgi:multiple sugar transport system ATP-binding protein
LARGDVRFGLAPTLAQRLRAADGTRSQIILGVRPEDAKLSLADDGHAIPGEVFVVEDLGNERLVTLDLGGQYAVARAAADEPAEMGDRRWLTFHPGRAHLFDPETEARIDR